MNNKQCKCRTCGSDWSSEENQDRMGEIGYEAFKNGQDTEFMKRPGAEEEEEGEEQDGEDNEEAPATQGKGKKGKAASKNGRGKKVASK